MRYLLLFIFIGFTLLHGQIREERPLPQFPEEPTSVLADSVLGWSFSKDGQWMSKEKTILPRLISRNEAGYDDKENRLGVDNFDELQLYPVVYGTDTLVLLIKLYTSGRYKYSSSKKGWKTRDDAYYFLFKMEDLRKSTQKIDTTVSLNKIKLVDGGTVTDIKPKNVLNEVLKKAQVRERYDRVLALMLQAVPETDKVRFHLYSLHAVFPDVEGVLKDFRKGGRSLYGNIELFEYNYYETKSSIFYRFFSIPKNFNIEQR